MDAATIWAVVLVVNAVVYVGFVRLRGEGSWWSTILLVVLLGPLSWFAWLGMRAGRRRAAEDAA